MKVQVKESVKYGGHNQNPNGVVSLTFIAPYSELTKSIETMQMLNENVSIKAKLQKQPVVMLGTFMIKQVVIDGDGESKLKFQGMSDFIEMDNLNMLPLQSADVSEFKICMEADVDIEEEDDE